MKEALNAAIDDCLKQGILYETLREHRSEVLGMLLEEFDADKYERTIRMEGKEEGRKEGREEGKREGKKEGVQEGIDRANKLTRRLLAENRTEDLQRALTDAEYQEKLFRELDL